MVVGDGVRGPPGEDPVDESEAHRLMLLDLGFPETVAAEAKRAFDRGRTGVVPSPGIFDETVRRIRSSRLWDDPLFVRGGKDDA